VVDKELSMELLILTEENRSTGRKTVSGATLFTTTDLLLTFWHPSFKFKF